MKYSGSALGHQHKSQSKAQTQQQHPLFPSIHSTCEDPRKMRPLAVPAMAPRVTSWLSVGIAKSVGVSRTVNVPCVNCSTATNKISSRVATTISQSTYMTV